MKLKPIQVTRLSQCCGFTLVELLIVIVIVGIIATVGYPTYINITQSTYRSAGQSDLMAFAGAMERHKLANYTYKAAAINQADTGKPLIFAPYSPSQEPVANKLYDLTISELNTQASQYTIKATPVIDGVMDGQGALYYFSDGRKAWDKNNDGIIGEDEYCWQC